MRRRELIGSGATLGLGALALPVAAAFPKPSLREKLTTRAERTGYRESSSLADVQRFLLDLDARGAPIVRGSLGQTAAGRDVPYVVAARPQVRTPQEARALKRPIVFVQGAIDASKVEGKEAILAIVRDLCLSTEKTLLDDIVLVVVPILDVDGNERLGPAAQNAPEQNGPSQVGTSGNGQGILLDRDFVRMEAGETQALIHFLQDWKPDVYLDLSSSDGSFHEFGVTYAPSLHPAAYYGGVYVRDHLLPAVRKEVREKFGIETFPYGHFGRTRVLAEPAPASDTLDYGWFPRDYRPRIGVNYMGLRGTLAVLISAYAHDPLERRIFTTRAFVETTLGYCSDNDDEVVATAQTTLRWIGGSVPVRAALAEKPTNFSTIEWEKLALAASPEREPGVPEGFKRTGTYGSASLPVFDRYVGAKYRPQPKSFVVPAAAAQFVEPYLRVHGIFYETATAQQSFTVQDFVVETIDSSPFPVNGHRTSLLAGRWLAARTLATRPGDLVIPGPQPLGPLVSVLLEPESDDGFFSWNVFSEVLAINNLAPISRVVAA